MTVVAEHLQARIAGQWATDTCGGELVSINPADGAVIARILGPIGGLTLHGPGKP